MIKGRLRWIGGPLVIKLSWVLATWLLSGCAVTLQGSATAFHSLDTSTRVFAIVPDKSQEGSLEFRTYGRQVSDQLTAHGWREGGFDEAQVAVFVQYGIGQGRDVAFSYPILGAVPTGNSTTTGTINTFGSGYGRTSNFNATTTQQTTVGVVGTGVGTRTEFDRALKVLMYSIPVYKQTGKLEPLYEGQIRSTGSTGDLATVMPTLVRGLLKEFPGTSGKTRSVSLPIDK
jgi:hypothetical protein